MRPERRTRRSRRIRAGEVVILPTDTVYGLAADGLRREPVERALPPQGSRATSQPTGARAASVDVLARTACRSCAARTRRCCARCSPARCTLVVPNPARRFPWLTGARPEAIGIRVPALDGVAARRCSTRWARSRRRARTFRAGPTRAALEDVPAELVERCAAVLDGGRLPGVASTVHRSHRGGARDRPRRGRCRVRRRSSGSRAASARPLTLS